MATTLDPLLRIPHLYHFTNVLNLPKIKQFDGLLATAHLREGGEEFCAGGDDASLSLDANCGMDKYVHLCFREKHPMAFRIRERKPEANLIYLTIDRAILHQPGVMFATGVGYANDARIIGLAEVCDQNLIDFQALYAWTDWKDPEAQAKRRAAELCEILVPDYVPMAFIRNFPNG